MGNLTGIKLTVVSITRQSLFDADYIGCCDNCGKIICNIASVKDDSGKCYEIGLDCKKTLIDKPIIDKMKLDGFMGEYNAKEYKQQTTEAEKFLKFCSYPEVDINIDSKFGEVIIYDRLPHKMFPTVTGNIIYSQNLGYLYKIGFKEFINKLMQTKKAIPA